MILWLPEPCPDCYPDHEFCPECGGTHEIEVPYDGREGLISMYFVRARRSGLIGDCAALAVVADLYLELDPAPTLEEVRRIVAAEDRAVEDVRAGRVPSLAEIDSWCRGRLRVHLDRGLRGDAALLAVMEDYRAVGGNPLTLPDLIDTNSLRDAAHVAA